MGLASYVTRIDVRAVLAHWLAICAVQACSLLPPAAVAIAHREHAVAAVLLSLAAALFALSRVRRRFVSRELPLREAMVLTALTYLGFAAAAALPFLFVAAPLDAFFEAMSAITTTGLSSIEPHALTPALIFFRSYCQWIGGAGIVILSLAIVFGAGKTSLDLLASERGERDLVGNVRSTARVVARIYLLLTVLGCAVLLLARVPAGDAVTCVLSTLSTGGFAPSADSVGAYSNAWSRAAFIPLMLLGATSFALHYRAWHRGPRALWGDLQLRSLLLLAALGAALIYLAERGAGGGGLDALFGAVSAVTTTGFTVVDPREWSAATTAIVIVLMVLGGCTGSTAGGLKLRRVILMVKSATIALTRASLPREAQTPMRYGDAVIDAREERLLASFLALYLLTLLVSTLALALLGIAPSAALFESASALGTVGLSAGVTGPELPSAGKLVLIFDMWAGRLEILPVLLCVSLRTWTAKGAGT